MIPERELEELIEKWRKEAVEYESPSGSGYYRSEVRRVLARELEELVESSEPLSEKADKEDV